MERIYIYEYLLIKKERYLINLTIHINKLVKKQINPKASTRKVIIEIIVEINRE